MMLYVLCQVSEFSGGALMKGAMPTMEQLRLRQGERISSYTERIVLHFKPSFRWKTKNLDVIPTMNPSFPIVSSKLKAWLSSYCPDNVQFFPVEVLVDGVAEANHGLWALNVASKFNAIDLDKSKYDWAQNIKDPDSIIITGFRTIVLRPEIDRAPPIFREEAYHSFILVTQAFKDKCGADGLAIEFLSIYEMASGVLVNWKPPPR